MSYGTRRHMPVVVRQCEKCPYTYMSVGVGPGAVDIRLAFPRPVALDRHGDEATGTCPLHPRSNS